MRTCFFLKLYSQLKHYFCQHRIIFIGNSITCKECMDTKILCTFFFQDTESLEDLLRSHSILCITRVVHNIIADLKYTTWVVTAADGLWNTANCTLHTFNVGNIIQIDDTADLIRIFKLLLRRIIRRKHNVSFLTSNGL